MARQQLIAMMDNVVLIEVEVANNNQVTEIYWTNNLDVRVLFKVTLPSGHTVYDSNIPAHEIGGTGPLIPQDRFNFGAPLTYSIAILAT